MQWESVEMFKPRWVITLQNIGKQLLKLLKMLQGCLHYSAVREKCFLSHNQITLQQSLFYVYRIY